MRCFGEQRPAGSLVEAFVLDAGISFAIIHQFLHHSATIREATLESAIMDFNRCWRLPCATPTHRTCLLGMTGVEEEMGLAEDALDLPLVWESAKHSEQLNHQTLWMRVVHNCGMD